MTDYLEIWKPSGRSLVPLERDRYSLGHGDSNDVAIDQDPEVSRLHAVLERYAGGWSIRDLGSRNGTHVNGERIWQERGLRDGDEVRLGQTRIVFKGEAASRKTMTAKAAPVLTPREQDVLVTLCRPLLSGSVFTDAASNREIARDLVITEAAVKKHLARLYDKFGVDEGERRRVRLANEAIHRGAVSMSDLSSQG